VDPIKFRSLLKFTSWPLSLVNPKIRLGLAQIFSSEAIRTILDPNSINSRYRNRFGDIDKKIEFSDGTSLLVNINEMIGYRSALNGNWDRTTFNTAHLMQFEQLHYVDVGANIGTTLIPIANQGCRCVAFEPNLDVAWRLLVNLKDNFYAEVEVNLTALGEYAMEGSWLPMQLDPGNSGAVSLIAGDYSRSSGKSVMINSMDSALSLNFLNSLRSSEGKLLIKIDVEGFEAKVIRGGLKTIREFSPVIILEQNPGEEFQSALEELRIIGYNFFTITEDLRLGPIDSNTRYENIIAIPTWAKDFFST
jgi:FkbM family methyltransferase